MKQPTTSDNSLTSTISYCETKASVNFTGSSLKQPNILYTDEKSSKHLHFL